jgi:serine/threonine protein kinase/Tol biopolymer transport system component
MDSARWRRVEEIYHAAVERKPEERAVFLAVACAGDEDLRREVESLLAQPSDDGVLDRPAWEPEAGGGLSPDAARLAAGQRVSHYQIQKKLGEGGMGAVYLAYDTQLRRPVALKVLPPEHASNPERRSRLLREARAASALNHPNIVGIYEVGSDHGVDFIAMEFIEGKSLGDIIPGKGLPLGKALDYAVQIASGLAKAHAAGVIHRDLKPGNIMLTGPASGHPGLVKLLDFGLARRSEPEEGHDTTLTVENEILGTPAYMSPEQAQGKPVDARSDVFSFGSVLYQMVTGRRAFEKDSHISTLAAVIEQEPRPLPSSVPRDLERIIARCLRKDPARRFQAMPDLKVALEELKEESDSGTADMAAGSTGAPLAKARPRLMLAAATVTLLVVAAWFFLRPASKPLPPMQSVPLTTYTGSQGHPSFSPDGSQVAFEWTGEKGDHWDYWPTVKATEAQLFDWNDEKADHLDIYVKLVEGGTPLRLTTSPAPAVSPAWSADGGQIAFLRPGGVYLISPLGGPERKLTDTPVDSLAWMPDSQSLLVSSAKSPMELHGIFELSLRSGEMRPVTSPPPPANPGDGDYDPAVSPDGRTLAFLRGVRADADVYVQRLAGGPARRLTKRSQQLHGPVWASNREVLFYSTSGVSGSIWRMLADGSSEQQPVAGVLDGAREPAISHPVNGPVRMAYTHVANDTNIWCMEIAPDGHGGVRTVAQPASIIASTRAELSPQFSPDGKRIVFESDRDGYPEIWVAASDGSGAAQLTMLKSPRSGSARWSPDGTRIVFDSLASGDNDIWMVGSEGGPPKQLTTEPANDARPSFSRDGRWIYFRSDRSGSQQIWKIPSSAPFRPAARLTQNGGFDADEALDGKLLYYTRSQGGLWSMPVEGGEGTMVLENVLPGLWALAENGIYYLDVAGRSPDGAAPLMWFSFATHKLVQVGAVRRPIIPATPTVSVTSDGRRIAWSQIDRQQSELMLIENFR